MTAPPELTDAVTGTTLALLAFPDRAPSTAPTGVLARLRAAARYRRNPRSADYMRQLLASEYPDAELAEITAAVPVERIAAARRIVLLWADAIGFGWAPIERSVFKTRARGASVIALTGRRRRIELTPGALVAFRARRLAEHLWLGEIAIVAAMLCSAPLLVAWDAARGRR